MQSAQRQSLPWLNQIDRCFHAISVPMLTGIAETLILPRLRQLPL
jgi:hypothetical protein